MQNWMLLIQTDKRCVPVVVAVKAAYVTRVKGD